MARIGKTAEQVRAAASALGLNIRVIDNNTVGLSFGESITKSDVADLLKGFDVSTSTT